MRKTLLYLVLVLVVSRSQSQTINPFEGTMEFKVQNIERVLFYNALVKGERMRIEPALQEDYSSSAILDHYDKKMYAVMKSMEQYAEFPLNDETIKSPSIKIEQTGEQETIADLDCQQLIITFQSAEIEVWATKSVGSLGGFISAVSLTPNPNWMWESQLRKLGYTPLRIVQRKDGEEMERLEVTSITEKGVSDASFRVPRQYEKVTTLAPPELKPLVKKKPR